ncbi:MULTISPECIES: hypothetical protein [Lysobacter]|uniref:HEAT repeat domain-containing protein n=1 Tax=Lysobacter gummosus TaxID=262324 RepID=A0ABY3XG01_9GAMM|nr:MULTISPECIES: hypothetical protein [Lysobacter]ALN89977.1 hypothetical protein LG3211_1000 [Lysobacter gummosus]UJB18157.1 hypothetical protein L1A79_17645 [Lysobacter capsici]UJQ28120.1 hypothetical protein L2D09_22240 [Lysobacter gummosus]UNP30564.1 hypothetical protein MOV92_04650 [Lysobacter gummosus]
MAYTLNATATSTASEDDLFDYIFSRVDSMDPDSIADAAPVLAAYASDSGLVARTMAQSMRSILDGQPPPFVAPQCYVIARRRHIMIRANVWTPLKQTGALRKNEERVYSYDTAHDHNFNFLTIGYFGAGYRTHIVQIDPSQLNGEIGDSAPILDSEVTSLPKGKIMLYQAHRDVHRQAPPDELSISLNVLFNNQSQISKCQYNFVIEEERARILSYTSASIHSRLSMLAEMAVMVGGDELMGLFNDIVDAPLLPPRMRLMCLEGLREDQAAYRGAMERLYADESDMVRLHARSALSQLQ